MRLIFTNGKVNRFAKQTMYLISATVIFSSCIREELPVPVFDRGETQIKTVSIGGDYGLQVWYSLSLGDTIKSNKKTDWEIALDARPGINHIYLNTSLLMQAVITEDNDLISSKRPPRSAFRPDHPSGFPDSLVIKDWKTANHVIWLDLGFDPLGNQRGYCKIKINNEGEQIRLTIMQEEGSPDTLTLELDDISDRKMISLTDRQIVDIEPASRSWDLLFTQYTQLFYEPYTPYLVVGLLNSPHTSIYRLEGLPFDQVTRNHLSETIFMKSSDGIGYDWKTFDFDTGLFQIEMDWVYIIEDAQGFLYKLSFLDFYDQQGVRGSITFQIELL